MNHASLFSGIGGFDLAAERMGWENMFHCEWNPFGKKVLNYYWPKAISYDDITKTDFTIHRGKIDILTGGFPCQPYSTAGKRLGKEDDRHLWPEMLRAIREIKPKFIVGENVSGLLSWNGGLVFNEVQTDLEAQGYEVQPVLLPACSVNAPHRRDRIWFVAYSRSERCHNGGNYRKKRHVQNDKRTPEENKSERKKRKCRTGEISKVEGVVTNPQRIGQQEQGEPARPMYSKKNTSWKASWADNDGRWPTQSPICSRDDGLSRRLDGITFPKWRQESIKAYGNAIVPQVALQIFKAINDSINRL